MPPYIILPVFYVKKRFLAIGLESFNTALKQRQAQSFRLGLALQWCERF